MKHIKKFQDVVQIIQMIPMKEYVISMENSRFTGQWTGLFSGTQEGEDRIVLRKKGKINCRNGFPAYFFEKIQGIYLPHLKKALKETKKY